MCVDGGGVGVGRGVDGEYNECGKTVAFSDFRHCFTISDVCPGALSNSRQTLKSCQWMSFLIFLELFSTSLTSDAFAFWQLNLYSYTVT